MKNALKIFAAMGFAAIAAGAARPYQPFVEKVFTPDRSRQLKVALHQDLWILYDLPQCQLYQAWKGGTAGGELELANFGWFNQEAHFPNWFTSAGTNYFKESVGEYFASWTKAEDITLYYTKWKSQPRNYKAWTVANGATAVNARVKPKGYNVKGDVFKLNFALILPDGKEISITETPDYATSGGKTNLVRKMTFAGIPAGHTVKLALPAAGTGGSWAVTGTGTLASGALSQPADGETTITGSW